MVDLRVTPNENPHITNKKSNFATFPTELLSFIFEECFDAGSEHFGCPQPRRNSAPMSISSVCRRWREVALSMPQLWTRISLGSVYTHPSVSDARLLELYLSRAGDTAPLSFEFQFGQGEEDEEVRLGAELTRAQRDAMFVPMEALARVVEPLRHRWEVLAIRGRTLDDLDDFLAALARGTPALKHCVIAARTNVFGGPQRHLSMKDCPRLDTLALVAPKLFLDPFRQEAASLSGLSTLDLCYSSSQQDAFFWMECCPNLERVSIQFFDAPSFPLPYAPPLTLPRLVTFALSCFYGDVDPRSLLSLLTLPALQILTLYFDRADFVRMSEEWPFANDMLERSRPPLRMLELLGTSMGSQEAIRCLRLAPGLKNLVVEGEMLSDELLQLLRISHAAQEDSARGTDLLCPILETIEIHAFEGSMDLLAEAVRSRCGSPHISDSEVHDGHDGQSLSMLVFAYNKDGAPRGHPVLKQCEDLGLKVVYKNCS